MKMHRTLAIAPVGLVLALAILLPWVANRAAAQCAGPTNITLASVASDGAQGNGMSTWASISADGRFVAFQSESTNLVSGSTPSPIAVYVHDRLIKQTVCASVSWKDHQPQPGRRPSISADGRYVAFETGAPDIVPNDTGGLLDIMVFDRETSQTTRVSVHSSGAQASNGFSMFPSISADGRYVAFESSAGNLIGADLDHDGQCEAGEGCDTNGETDIFVHDQQTHQTVLVSRRSDGKQANGHSHRPALSADGRFVVFDSGADNLVDDDTNGAQDVFVHDRLTGQTTRVSAASDGTQGNSISGGWVATLEQSALSADGRYVAFSSAASNLVIGDTNGKTDIFVHDCLTGQTVRVSVLSDGTQANDHCVQPSISGDGRYVTFDSAARSLFPPGIRTSGEIFLHDRDTDNDGVFDEPGATSLTWISRHTNGRQLTSSCSDPVLSAQGRHIAFTSSLTDLVNSDTNGGVDDVFVYGPVPAGPGLVFRVDNCGNVFADGTFSSPAADFAECWPVSQAWKFTAPEIMPLGHPPGSAILKPGDVLALGTDGGVMLAGLPGAGPIVGVYATRPGLLAGGPVLASASTPHSVSGSVPVALAGIVPVNVSIENGTIQPGDLITLGSKPGWAARAEPSVIGKHRFHLPGSFFGKALDAAESDGTIRLLLTLP